MEFPERYDNPISARRQFFYLFLICVAAQFAGAIIGMVAVAGIYGVGMIKEVAGLTTVHSANYVYAMRMFLGFGNTVIGYWTPALFFGFLIVRKPHTYLKYETHFSPVLLFFVLVFMVAFMPIIDITTYWNQKLTLPPSMKGLDQWIRDTETQNAAIFKVILDMRSTGDLVVCLFIIGFLPAISEEFLFRGCILSILRRWGLGVHSAVWISAFIFSFIHFEFLGFVPRMLLGAGLGYLCAWSGSIWPSVFAHFLNNGFVVVVTYLYQRGKIKIDPDSNAPMFQHMWIYGLFFVVSIAILYLYKSIAAKNLVTADGEELD